MAYNLWKGTFLVLIVILGLGLGGALSEAWDNWVWGLNTHEDGAGNPVLDLEKYKVQVIEAHIWGWGMAIIIEMGLLAWWLEWSRKL